MNYRKMIKRKARISVKEHYGIWVVLCLVLMIISGGRLVDYSIARTEVTARLNLPFKGKDPVSEEIYEEDPRIYLMETEKKEDVWQMSGYRSR